MTLPCLSQRLGSIEELILVVILYHTYDKDVLSLT